MQIFGAGKASQLRTNASASPSARACAPCARAHGQSTGSSASTASSSSTSASALRASAHSQRGETPSATSAGTPATARSTSRSFMALFSLVRPSRWTCARSARAADPPTAFSAQALSSETPSSLLLARPSSSWLHIGDGNDAFDRAAHCLLRLHHFDLTWCFAVSSDDAPISPAARIAVAAKPPLPLRVWITNPLEVGAVQRDGDRSLSISLCCCLGHVLEGAEHFELRKESRSGKVWFKTHSVSRPAGPLGLASLPLIRALQRRFLAECGERVRSFVTDGE